MSADIIQNIKRPITEGLVVSGEPCGSWQVYVKPEPSQGGTSQGFCAHRVTAVEESHLGIRQGLERLLIVDVPRSIHGGMSHGTERGWSFPTIRLSGGSVGGSIQGDRVGFWVESWGIPVGGFEVKRRGLGGPWRMFLGC